MAAAKTATATQADVNADRLGQCLAKRLQQGGAVPCPCREYLFAGTTDVYKQCGCGHSQGVHARVEVPK